MDRTPSSRIHHIPIFVADQDRSVEFFRDCLGFSVTVDHKFETGARFVLVEPPDGGAALALLTPSLGSPTRTAIGGSRGVVLVTGDVEALFQQWSSNGVRFKGSPRLESWGGIAVTFADPDGNEFILSGWDAITREIEAKRLAIAAQAEAERRAAWENALARDVQARLFPQGKPSDTGLLEYAGRCVQSRSVGGDYYDFLNLGPERFGLVVADVAGKGFPAALLMAHLQANIRSQAAWAASSLEGALETVNRHFLENSPEQSFATMFYAIYDRSTRRLRFANCGHVTGFVLRADGTALRLTSTCGMIGLFSQWTCVTDECSFDVGDHLLLVSDGVMEAENPAGDEFGEARLLELSFAQLHSPVAQMVSAIVDGVQRFTEGLESDDMTVVVARPTER